MNFKIDNLEIGCNKPPVVVAEIGINHGSLTVTKKWLIQHLGRN